MSFQPVLPFAGVSGWAFLNKTREAQQEAFNSTPVIQRDIDYFQENISLAKTAEDLVADRRLLSVALGAFGLDDDINNKFFIKKILEDGTLDSDALANKLSDKRYYAFAKAFGYGDFSVANTQISDFADKILPAFQDRQFEIAIGTQSEEMRLAMGMERELNDILSRDTTENGMWFSILGTPPLRRIFEVGMGMPAFTAMVDLDQQLDMFRNKAEKIFGDGEVKQFSDPKLQEKLVRLFLVRSESSVEFNSTSPGATAVALLQNAGFASSLV